MVSLLKPVAAGPDRSEMSRSLAAGSLPASQSRSALRVSSGSRWVGIGMGTPCRYVGATATTRAAIPAIMVRAVAQYDRGYGRFRYRCDIQSEDRRRHDCR